MIPNMREDNIQRIQAVAAEKNVTLSDGAVMGIAMKYGDSAMRLSEVYREVDDAIGYDNKWEIPDDDKDLE